MDDALPLDEHLMAAVASCGDPEAFRLLFLRYYRKVFGYFRWRVRDEATAEDLASETFLQLYKTRETWRPENGGSFRGRLFRLAKWALWRSWNRRKSLPIAAEFQPAEVCSREPACDARLVADEMRDAVESVVCRLPEPEFLAVRRHFWEGVGQVEIAEAEGVSHQRISQRVQAAQAVVRNDPRVQHVLFGQRVSLAEAVA